MTHQSRNNFDLLCVVHLFCTNLHFDLKIEHLLMEIVGQNSSLKHVEGVEAAFVLLLLLAGNILSKLALLLLGLRNRLHWLAASSTKL
jgi:hypothetical protein